MQAPEVMQGGKPSAASDVYSFGMVLYELLTWTLPWRASPFKASVVGAGCCLLRGAQTSPVPVPQGPLLGPVPCSCHRFTFRSNSPPPLLQVRRWVVLEGLRPEVPPRAELPGPDTATYAGLDAFVQLMQ